MDFEDPEQELERFLSTLPSWHRKQLLGEEPSQDEIAAWCQDESWWFVGGVALPAKAEYERLLQRIPAKWQAYRNNLKRIALQSIPSGKPGRPRADRVRKQGRQLQAEGKSYAQIATLINQNYGPGTTTPEAMRKLLRSRKDKSVPDKN